MSQGNTAPASAINLSDIAAHPTEAFAALINVVEIQGKEIELLQENQTILFDLVTKLKSQMSPNPSEVQTDRATMLRLLLVANNGKMLAKDARQRMHVSKSTFSRLLATMKADIEIKTFHADRRKDVLILRSENG